jgi:hypothetical protein
MPRQIVTLSMQLAQMYGQGQSFFTTLKVQDWLKMHNQNPEDYDIVLHEKPAPPGSQAVIAIEVELRRRDGQPVDPWLLAEANRQA